MRADEVAAFDDRVEDVMRALVRDGTLAEREGRFELDMTATVVWGRPAGGPDLQD